MFKIVICPSLRKYMASQIACRFRTNSVQNWRIPTIGLLFLTVTNFELQKQHASTLQQFHDCGNSVIGACGINTIVLMGVCFRTKSACIRALKSRLLFCNRRRHISQSSHSKCHIPQLFY